MQNYGWNAKKKKKDNLIFFYIGGGLLVFFILVTVIFLFGKKDNKSNSENNLGEEQRRQVREISTQLIANILDNQSNYNQLISNPDGTRRSIDDIEEVFLSGSQSPNEPAPSPITNSIPFEVIEQTWYEIRVFIFAGLQNSNQSLIDSARLRIKNDIEKWLRWEIKKIKGDYNKLLGEYLKVVQELKTIRELFEKYCQIRTDLVINKVDRSKELITKGYSEKDIEKLTEWGLLELDFPNLLIDEKRIGVTNTLSVSSRETTGSEKRGNARGLSLFLKPHNKENYQVYFPENIVEEQQNTVKQLIENLLDRSKLGKEARENDIYILRVGSKVKEGKISGPSSGIAHYLALYSALNKVPLPRNLASTGTIEGDKVGAIGGLKYKLEAAVNKKDIERRESNLDIFILSEENKNNEWRLNEKGERVRHKYPEIDSYEDIKSPLLQQKVKQVHFISQVDQIETALLEILKEPNRHIIHSCSTKPPEVPRENPNLEITPEKLFSLMAECVLREPTQDQRDFFNKLHAQFLANEGFSDTLQSVLALHKKYLQKFQETEKSNSGIDEAKELAELDKLERRILDYFTKLEKAHNQEVNLTESDRGDLDNVILAIGENEWLPKDFKDVCTETDLEKNDFWEFESTLNGPYPGHKYDEEKRATRENFDLARNEVKERNRKGREGEKKLILQQYESSFKVIVSKMSTTEILTNLEKKGYIINKIEWTGKLHAPSLTGETSVSVSLTKK